MWLLVNDQDVATTIWSLDAGTTDFVMLRTAVDGVTVGVYDDNGGGAAVLRITGPTVTASWYFVAFAMSGTNGTLWWGDASAAALSTASSGAMNTTTPTTFRVGESPVGGEDLVGRVADLKVWDGVALSDAEVEAERWSRRPQRTDSLFGWWPFEVDAVDYSGQGATLSGGVNVLWLDGPPSSWMADPPELPWVPEPPIATQDIRPAGDITVNAWVNEAAGTTDLWQSIDEVTPSDADYVTVSV
jgi:hypothetical protein